MDRWTGKVAIVTGASSGIGAAIAERLVIKGLTVAGLARRKDRIEELAQNLSNRRGKLHAIKTDVQNEEEILNAFEWVKTNLGPIHILINSAGCGRYTTLMEGDAQKWREIFDTNVLGLCIATREAVRNMKANNVNGHIIHINSIGGHTIPYIPNLNVYPGSKHAVTAITEVLRQELVRDGSKIKISSISPASVLTEIMKASGYPNLPHFQNVFEGPVLTAGDIADAAEYILSTPPHVQVHDIILQPVGKIY